MASADLLHVEEKVLTVANWKKWLGEFGILLEDKQARLIYNNYPLLIQSCLDSQGVLLGWHHMIYDLIESGKLIRPITEVLQTKNGFYLITVGDRSLNTNAKLFFDWVKLNADTRKPAICFG